LSGAADELPPLHIQYKDYAVWQQKLLNTEAAASARSYWLDKLSLPLPLLHLSEGRQRSQKKTFNGGIFTFRIDAGAATVFNILCKREGGSLFMGLLAVVNGLIARYTQQYDLIIGTPVAGREHADLKDQIGFYVNTLPLRITFDGKDSFQSLFAHVRESVFNAFKHQLYPLDEIVKELRVARDASRATLFDVLVSLQNNSRFKATDKWPDGLQVRQLSVPNTAVKFDLAVKFSESGDAINFNIDYNSDLFSAPFIERFGQHVIQFMKHVIATPHMPVATIDFITIAEKEQMARVNDTKATFPENQTIVSAFINQVNSTPSHIAVVHGEERMTYQDLHLLSDQFAIFLSERHSVSTDDFVGVLIGRSSWIVISMISLMKMGAVFVPMDEDHPEQRRNHMKADAGLKMIIGDDVIRHFLSGKEAYSGRSFSSPVIDPKYAAYMIYTSGSTGLPKGVVTSHRSIINYNEWFTKYCGITSADSSLLLSSMVFSGVYTSIFGTLLKGGALHIISKIGLDNAEFLSDYILKNQITFLKITPSNLHLLVRYGNLFTNERMGLRLLIVGGDRVKTVDFIHIRKNNTDIRVLYHYGSTETSMGALVYEVTDDNIDSFASRPVLGKPLSNVEVYILDETDNIVPVGVSGRICVAGEGLSAGYLNGRVLSQDRFFIHRELKKRFFDMGDVGRRVESGDIELIGRNDSQVKIRGYRVDIREIQQALKTHPEITDVEIGVIQDGQDGVMIVAYITGGKEFNVRELRGYLKASLPEYLIPARFVQLENLPLTVNGKVDRKMLTEFADRAMTGGAVFTEAETPLEEEITKIWEDVLKRRGIGVLDSFFELGGNSLNINMLANRYFKLFNVRIPLNDIFRTSTIREHALLVSSARRETYQFIPQADIDVDYPLSNSQQRLWTICQFKEANPGFNIPITITLEGMFDIAAFDESLNIVIARHEILRTLFRLNKEHVPRQYVLPVEKAGIKTVYTDYRYVEDKEARVLAEVKRLRTMPFDLSEGPLIRVSLLHCTDEKYVLNIVQHHIISDGWSMHILSRELITAYNNIITGSSPEFPALRIHYKDYAVWQRNLLDNGLLDKQRNYWLNALSGELKPIELQQSRERSSLQSFKGNQIREEVDVTLLSEMMLALGEKETPLYILLLSLTSVVLYKFSRQQDILVGVPFAGREHVELEDQIGFYVNLLPVRIHFREDESFAQLFKQIKRTMIDANENQIYPLDELLDKLITGKGYRRDVSKNAIFDVVVSHLKDHLEDAERDMTFRNIKVSNYGEAGISFSRFDLLFHFVESKGKVYLTINYNTDLYERSFAETLMSGVLSTLHHLIRHQEMALVDTIYVDSDSQLLRPTFASSSIEDDLNNFNF